ncbi:protein disulfide-isomerase [Marchantia polymorpha subsp. ruderalis]|uniref:BSD2 cysteine rich domain-containing protein n=2 Tax=Marchantia polymorpha TaxID=3197 RepID=A0AAF6ALH0_MARPO|nr:hypothetical protein MARPO_0005s0157 [Marchantia polymorpha]BBM97290.1 hypothetical protein Mp_1g04500 [Marchantia polymorpha subsp. ruderalis]|eukprot:PTQ48517.1 hypothetical protein MARPO_0005s0157 [Marchantia polymorpha]
MATMATACLCPCAFSALVRADTKTAPDSGNGASVGGHVARNRPGLREFQKLNAGPLFTPLAPTRRSLPCPRADLDQDTILAIGVGVAGLAVGIGIPVFYETQVKGSEKRENDQPCFPCKGTGSQTCRFCAGAGNITVMIGVGEKEVSSCINCEGNGAITCTTCQGSGVQPRYLDRREFKDDD